MSSIRDLLEGKIDFHGQKKADDITRIALIAITVLSFVLGFALQSLRVMMGTFSFSTVALALVVLPPWPAYNRHPVKWQPAQPAALKSK
ncbi:microsomal signal peptidase 12 kDa subunit [Boletus edulis]|uniref:Signal peptidase complex subunit 1 n=1 Tax=Boletus edulis BED1 TaxID=1328754 RepID=A0AAD4C8P3_BOLED|nr:microsomal signal peptidase 12 kDa subunit [Boletus edulis]KAF8452506.1 microsomal signal peptidase 12 kDa subunit [Boletus edulis BED1]